MADFATGGVIPPGSWVTFGAGGCELHVPPQPTTVNVTLAASSGELDAMFTAWLTKAIRTGKINPDDPGTAGVLARV